jgi:hypothetical protein
MITSDPMMDLFRLAICLNNDPHLKDEKREPKPIILAPRNAPTVSRAAATTAGGCEPALAMLLLSSGSCHTVTLTVFVLVVVFVIVR